jgi:hypothetical protein
MLASTHTRALATPSGLSWYDEIPNWQRPRGMHPAHNGGRNETIGSSYRRGIVLCKTIEIGSHYEWGSCGD